MHVHRGHLLHITGSPAIGKARDALVCESDGALVVDALGRILYSGPYRRLPDRFRIAVVRDHRPAFLIPGFVDAHVHFPQVFSVAAYGGGTLLHWLGRCIFPAESRLSDPVFARRAAQAFCSARIRAGTTAAMVFGSAFPEAQDALFEETALSGLRMVSGRGIQTRGPVTAAPLMTGEREAEDMCRAEFERWHCADQPDRPDHARLQVALVPRFSLSVTTQTLRWLGDLYDELRNKGVYFHSHLSENDAPGTGEVDAVCRDFGTTRYLDTYDGAFLPGSIPSGRSLLGRRSILAHAVHCTDSELARLADTGTSIAHCPTSQLFLGSGTMPWLRTVRSGVTVALGSDVGAGDEWLISRVANDCFKVHISEKAPAATAIDPAALLFTATMAGARALDMEARFGNLDAGKDADFLVVDPRRWAPLSTSLDSADGSAESLAFALLMTMRESAITGVYVAGREISAGEPGSGISTCS
ncbi:amidohydrolase family protein [Hoyosella subflava]|uniref:amidohydrolase family protein n=1 Tax=Hoyosella subflava TaxID=639313 RepID=UPI00059C952D|nr:amidohydrolase family protein [Hoyosella subflava]